MATGTEEKKLEEICIYARKLKLRRGEAALCMHGMKRKDLVLFFNFPDKASNAPDCLATQYFSTGHSTPDCYVDTERMYMCGKRCQKKGK